MSIMEYENVELLLLALTKFPTADIAKCPPNLIERARHLLQSVTVLSPASPPRLPDEEGFVSITVPFATSPPRPQDKEGLIPVTVPSSASPSRPQDEEGLVSITVPLSNGHTSDPVDASTTAIETKARETFEALLKAVEETKDLLKRDVKDLVRDDLSPAAYDPRVQDLEAGIGSRPSNAQKLRHIIILPKWLIDYDNFSQHSPSRGTLLKFATERGLKYGAAKEGIARARRLRDITSRYGKRGLEAPLGLIVTKWRRLTDEVRPVVARLCREDSTITKAMPALSKFCEECDAEYTVLLSERLAAVRPLACPKWTGGSVEELVDECQYGCVSGHENARLSIEGVGCEVFARHENQQGVKRSFQVFEAETYASSEDSLSVSQYSDDVPLHATGPSSVCTGSTAGMDS
jgi:hypothetical protein